MSLMKHVSRDTNSSLLAVIQVCSMAGGAGLTVFEEDLVIAGGLVMFLIGVRVVVDGTWGIWGLWNKCQGTCGQQGFRVRHRTCNNPKPQHNGYHCSGNNREEESCLVFGCDIATARTSSDPGRASAATRVEIFHKKYPELKTECFYRHCMLSFVKGIITEEKEANKYWSCLTCTKYGKGCPVSGGYSDWETWGACSSECGKGQQFRMRICDNPPPNSEDIGCTGPTHEVKDCLDAECSDEIPTERVLMTSWSEWSACSVTCGEYGTQESIRTRIGQPGAYNVSKELKWTKPCFLGRCTEDGGWSEWSNWTECTALCGKGNQVRLRLCNNSKPEDDATCEGNETISQKCEIVMENCKDK
ncbi:coadhesin-like, partial [Limulus polyphemus]|uniref:Coadhesin-like n=1 Tax=Limulus polyphemus TaxID=6850 RepID=A0ABM1T827_LIMPO